MTMHLCDEESNGIILLIDADRHARFGTDRAGPRGALARSSPAAGAPRRRAFTLLVSRLLCG